MKSRNDVISEWKCSNGKLAKNYDRIQNNKYILGTQPDQKNKS